MERGRPSSKFNARLVVEVAEQRLIAFYNERPELLRRKPKLAQKLRDRSLALGAVARAWLQALDHVDRSRPDFTVEAAFRFWCLRLEPPYPPEKLTPEKEQELRSIWIKHCTPEHWRLNCQPWVEAISRVQNNQQIKLTVPPPPPQDENDDEYL